MDIGKILPSSSTLGWHNLKVKGSMIGPRPLDAKGILGVIS